jgi:hypothetical protein
MHALTMSDVASLRRNAAREGLRRAFLHVQKAHFHQSAMFVLRRQFLWRMRRSGRI